MNRVCLLALAAVLAASLLVHGQTPALPSDDGMLEARMLHLAAQLRCLVCQNQTLAESNAEVAVDLRREMLRLARAGQSDAQIATFLVQRYGDFILYRPPFKAATALLWIGPFALLVAAIAGLLLYVRRRSRMAQAPALDADECRRAESVLAPGPLKKTAP